MDNSNASLYGASGYVGKFESVITDLLRTYTSSKAPREPEIDYQLDGN
ncbi:MAG: hypothetical protein ACI3VX_06710 [Faecousia sp.]